MKRYVTFIVFLLIISSTVFIQAKNISLSWDKNIETDIAGYRIYRGAESNIYDLTKFISVDTNNYDLSIPDRENIYFVVTAVNNNGIESDFSNEVILPNFPNPPKNIKIELKIIINN